MAWMLFCAAGRAQEEEQEGQALLGPCPHFRTLAGYEIADGEDAEFDARQFFNGAAMVTVEGRVWVRRCQLTAGAAPLGPLPIIQSHAAQVRSAGGRVFLEGPCPGESCGDRAGALFFSGKFAREGREIWVMVFPADDGGRYELIVAEGSGRPAAATADALLAALERDGFIALEIHFTADPVAIQADSRAVVEQLVALMKAHPELRLSIEGHTDAAGDPVRNRLVSRQRAEAVRASLLQAGVASGRLAVFGWGGDRPAAEGGGSRIEIIKRIN
jgi:hypothetical protein